MQLYFFHKKKIIKKIYVCLPYLKFSDSLPETNYFFHLASYKAYRLNLIFAFHNYVQVSLLYATLIGSCFVCLLQIN